MSQSSFEQFHGNAWGEHFKNTEAVAASLPLGVSLAEKPEHLVMMAKLIAHVEGEHLGEWERGRKGIASLKTHALFTPNSEVAASIDRFDRVLRYCMGDSQAVAGLAEADLARVLAGAAASLSGQGQDSRAKAVYLEAMKHVEKLAKSDPAQKDLAIIFNNLALGLEYKDRRTALDGELMLLAAKAGRRHWELAGTWLQVERAEYRLSKAFLASGDFPTAIKHAELCLEICAVNGAEPVEVFFGLEALARARWESGDKDGFAKSRDRAREIYQTVAPAQQSWCQEELEKLNSLS